MSDFKIEIPTDAEVTAVAKAMDVDGRLAWDSADHDKVMECASAREESRRLIIGVSAVRALMDGDLDVEELAAPAPAADPQPVEELPPSTEPAPPAETPPPVTDAAPAQA